MQKTLDEYIKSSILTSILLIIFGTIITIYPDLSITLFSTIIAIVAIIIGLILFIIDIKTKNNLFPIHSGSGGLTLLVSGCVLAIYPDTLTFIVPVLLGIWFVISSSTKFRFVFLLKNKHDKKWTLAIIMPVLSIICGILFILEPRLASETLTRLAGVIIIIYSISDIIEMIIFKRNIEGLKEIIENKIKLLNE